MAGFEYNSIGDFIEQADEAKSLHELHAAFVDALADLGVKRFSMMSLSGGPRVIMSSTPPGWASYYWRRRYYDVDAIADLALRRPTGFPWRDVEAQELTKEARALFAEARDGMGIKGGYCVPVHELNGCAGIIALYQDEETISPRAERALRWICHAAMDRAGELDPYTIVHDSGIPLTPRQRQVVGFASDGHSDWEIGQLLNLSENTVNGHMEAAKQRLGVRTRVQAVVRAVRQGWIGS